ncbi:MAG TPA: glycosyltransferase 87 family protein [Candidatus Nanopelagicales bacterium]|nr:glycosyltransferase 87 family protein [Candidatus Nanopelagicales bacterium]
MTGPGGRRTALVVLAVVAACLLVGVLARDWDPPAVQDLRVYRDAAQRVLDHLPVYPPGSRYTAGQPLPFTYPPFAALVLLPAALVPIGSAVGVWWLLSLLCLWWLARRSFAELLAPLSPVGRLAAGLIAAALALVLLDPVARLFGFGQVGLLLGVLCLADLDLGLRRSRAAGALVGLAAAVKITPGGFLLTYVAARRWRAVATGVVTTAACWLLALAVLPADTRDWLGLVLDTDRVGPVAESVNVSWNGLVLRLLGHGTAATVLWLVLAVGTLAVAALRSGRAMIDGDSLGAATVMGLGIVLAAPVSWTHHVVWIVPLIGILVGAGRSWWRWLLAVAVIAVFSAPGMSWVDDVLGTSQRAGVLDWFWVNTNILVMAAAVLLLPIGRARQAPSDG